MNYKRFLLVTGAAAVLAGGRVVNLRLALIGLVGLAGSGTVVHAEVLGSGALFSSGQNNAVCTVTNVSPSPSGVSNVRIFSSNGSPVSVNFENCDGKTFAPGHTCNRNANLLAPDVFYSCQVDTGEANGARFRGTMMIFDSSNKLLGTSDLR